jgi:sugar (pentulose or hexulose) kinase
MLFLGISIESQQTRAVVFSLESNAILSEGVAPHLAGNGFGFSDPSEWVRTVNESVHQCLGKIDHQRKRLAGISVAGPAQGMVLLDEENRLLEPTKKMEASAKRRAAQALGQSPG